MPTKLQSRSGQSLIEYLIIVAIVAVGTMSIVRVVGKNVSVQFANIAKALGSGDDSQLKAEAINAKMYKKKDLSNFLEGASSGDSSH
jgi:Flp pilus assembly pilin Flp